MNLLLKNNTYKFISPFFLNRMFWIYPLCLFLYVFSSVNAHAHPHSWIDLKTVVEGDETQITGFKMSWTFDKMTSLYMLDGENLSKKNRAKVLQKMADDIMNNLALEHYFTYFYDGKTPIKYTTSESGLLTQNKMKFTLHFNLPLSKPKLIDGSDLKLLVFEPSYFVQMSWLKEEDITLSPELAKRCSLTMIQPNPTSEQLAYAMSKPVGDDPDNELGELFTQRVMIKCSAEKE